MNQLNQELKAVQNSKAILKKQLKTETDPNIQEKIRHYIEGYNQEETRILDQLNIRLDDITLTDEKPPKEEEDDNKWQTYKNY